MRGAILSSAILSAALLLIACGNDASPPPPAPVAVRTDGYVSIDAAKVCAIFTRDCPRKTGQAYDDCVRTYQAIRVSAACHAMLGTITCDATQDDLDACWPKCNPATDAAATCDGPNIIECAATSRTYAYACEGVCATQNKTWSGSCGETYKRETSTHPTCWCE